MNVYRQVKELINIHSNTSTDMSVNSIIKKNMCVYWLVLLLLCENSTQKNAQNKQQIHSKKWIYISPGSLLYTAYEHIFFSLCVLVRFLRLTNIIYGILKVDITTTTAAATATAATVAATATIAHGQHNNEKIGLWIFLNVLYAI